LTASLRGRGWGIALLAVLAAMPGLVACGGGGDGDEDEVKEVVEQLAKSDPAVCDKMSARFLKQNFEGDKEQCKQRAEQDKSDEKVEIEKTEIDGDRATVSAKIARQEGRLKLVKDEGDWKLDDVEQ
jgi:hypothetical protein